MQTYIHGNFPVFEGFNHMQYQIRDPEGFARMLETIIETGRLPNPVVKKGQKWKTVKKLLKEYFGKKQSKITSNLPDSQQFNIKKIIFRQMMISEDSLQMSESIEQKWILK